MNQNTLRQKIMICMDNLWALGRCRYSDLRDAEKSQLTALIMQKHNISAQWEFIVEAPQADDVLPCLIKVLGSDNEDDRKDAEHHLLMQIKRGAMLFAARQIDELFQEYAEMVAEINAQSEDAPRYASLSEADEMLAAHNRDVAADMNSAMRRL